MLATTHDRPLDVEEEESTWAGQPSTIWRYSLSDGIDPDALKSVPEMSVRAKGSADMPVAPLFMGTDKSGTDFELTTDAVTR